MNVLVRVEACREQGNIRIGEVDRDTVPLHALRLEDGHAGHKIGVGKAACECLEHGVTSHPFVGCNRR